MSRIDELIAKYCPDGVEYKELQCCCNILDRQRKPITKALREAGKYPYYGANGIQDYVADYIFDGVFVLVGEDGSVITPGGRPVVTWAEGKIWVNNHAHIIEEKEGTLLRFLFHFIQTIDVTKLIHGNIPKLTGKDFKALKIPVPPLEVQREIVRVLDNFTFLTAELTARRKQYEYYRYSLLSFDEVGGLTKGKLETIADISTGSSNTNEAIDDGLYPFFVRSQTPLRKDVWEYDETAIITAGDGVGVGKVFHYVSGKYALHQRAYRIHINDSNVLSKYVFHYFQSRFYDYILKEGFHSSVSSIRRPMLNAFEIPVPNVEIQRKVVEVLDNFDAICSDLNIGLPAEIEARQKQYEYYRDLLLTFVETGETIARQTDRQNIIKLLQYVFGYVMVELEEVVGRRSSGATPSKNNKSYYDGGNIPWIRTQDVRFNEIEQVDSFITQKALDETAAKWIPRDCVIVAISGASAGRCAINKIEATTNQHCLNLEIDDDIAIYKYVFYCVSNNYETLLRKKQGARGDLNSSLILKTLIPLPSISKQRRIVELLDRFDSIVNNISDGLPAEIEARQKQYEYYRDKLLTFKEKE